ncbi:MAG: type II toxin-antitoxin system RelE/ParE family toxin [Roseivirga sp.]|nr:type II toxin-antitoxin system RelE/ParE family toxin [Roseivirga sp.]
MQVLWTDIAIDSLNNVYRFALNKWNEVLAENLLELVDRSIDSIINHPDIGISIPNTSFRYLIMHKHLSLYYQCKKDSLKILLIWDNRQNPKALSALLAKHQP